MLTAALVYACISTLCAFAGAASYRHRMLEVFIADFIIAALAAWLGGILAGSFGPSVGGIQLAAALGVAAPLVVLFNTITVPLTEERFVEIDLPATPATQPIIAAAAGPIIAAAAEPIIAAAAEPIIAAAAEPKIAAAAEPKIAAAAEPIIAAVDAARQAIEHQTSEPRPAPELPGATATPLPLKTPERNDLPEVA